MELEFYTYENRMENVPKAISFMEETLRKYHVKRQDLNEDLYYIDELLKYIANEHENTKDLSIQMNRRLGDVTILIFFDGKKLDLDGLIETAIRRESGADISEVEAGRMRELFRNYYQPKHYSHKYSGTLNTLNFMIQRSTYKDFLLLLASLLLGVGFGLALHAFAPDSVSEFVSEKVLLTVSNIFIRCIKMLVGPLIFFTIASSISSYTDLSSLGRMGRKIACRYVFNAVIALAVGTGLTLLIRPGIGESEISIENILKSSNNLVETAETTDVTLLDTIINIFPKNFFSAFVDSSIMQIIFISFLLGIATALLPGKTRDKICSFMSSGDQLFSKMVSIVMIFLPISVFCSMANAVATIGASSLLMIFKWLITLLIAFAIMVVIYLILIWSGTSIRPIKYLKGYAEAIIGTFAMGSCNSSLPLCITTTERGLGVSRQVSSFAVPVGASMHCASNCVFYMISLFFLVNLYVDHPVTPLDYPMMFLSIFILGIGAPSIPGSGPVCVAILLQELGMPMGLIALIIGLDPFVSMFKSACSCIEDSYVTLALAKSEGMIDDSVTGRDT